MKSAVYLYIHLNSLVDVLLDESAEKVQLPKGDTWSVHKFGGTCVGSAERIKSVGNIILNDDSERKLVVVSAMSKVTDMMYDLINRAQSRDESYISALDAVLEKHRSTALDLLDGDDLGSFLSELHHDVNNLKAMLRAIYIGIELFSLYLSLYICFGQYTFLYVILLISFTHLHAKLYHSFIDFQFIFIKLLN